MARMHARILCRIWRDQDFRDLTTDEQWLYQALLSQPTISNAGVLALTPAPWARYAKDMTLPRVEAALAGLAEKRYVVLDEDTGELLVRTFMRNDGVSSNGKVFKNALTVALQVQSEKLRRVLAAELRKVGTDDAQRAATELDPDTVDGPPETPAAPSKGNSATAGNADQKKSDRPRKSYGVGEGVGVGGKSPTVVGSVPSNRGLDKRAIDAKFAEFWTAYPRREAKKGAQAKFVKAVKDGTPPETIIAGAKRYAAYVAAVGREREKIKIPTTWLNNGCWDDELADRQAAPAAGADPVEWLRSLWQAADVASIERATRLRYERPDLPVGIDGKQAVADYFRDHRRAWIDQHHAEIIAQLTAKDAA